MPDVASTRPLIDKLGVRPGARVALARPSVAGPQAEGPFDELRPLLADRGAEVVELGPGEVPAAGTDLIFIVADSIDDLGRLGTLRGSLAPSGAIWVVSRKGRAATLHDIDVMDAAKSVGLVDNKVVAFSATHTSLRLVIPLALRPR